MCFFFFSSRRRHTRCSRDWSSDVCSSDLSGSDHYSGFGRAELVIEAGFEDLQVKQQVLREVETAAARDTVFPSNTATIPIPRIAEAPSRPGQVVGMHFFSPGARMPLPEAIPSART